MKTLIFVVICGVVFGAALTNTIEPTAPTVCQANEFRCTDGGCIHASLKCDRNFHCWDGTDELSCDGETACQNQKRNNSGNGPLQWDIECDAQGNYLPKQCTRQTPKWCACYNSQGLVTQPSRAIKSCECLLARHQLDAEGKRGCELPTCQRSGKYEKKQCCTKTGLCHCVNETTGEKTNQPSNNRNLQCP